MLIFAKMWRSCGEGVAEDPEAEVLAGGSSKSKTVNLLLDTGVQNPGKNTGNKQNIAGLQTKRRTKPETTTTEKTTKTMTTEDWWTDLFVMFQSFSRYSWVLPRLTEESVLWFLSHLGWTFRHPTICSCISEHFKTTVSLSSLGQIIYSWS